MGKKKASSDGFIGADGAEKSLGRKVGVCSNRRTVIGTATRVQTSRMQRHNLYSTHI